MVKGFLEAEFGGLEHHVLFGQHLEAEPDRLRRQVRQLAQRDADFGDPLHLIGLGLALDLVYQVLRNTPFMHSNLQWQGVSGQVLV
jgi:hypothetical protein